MNKLLQRLPNISHKQYLRSLQLLGHLFFLILIILSIVFYKERILHFDSAYYTFNLLFSEDFFIAHDRTVSYASQLLPLFAIKMGWSLKTVLVLYSLSFMLLFYAIYNIIVYGFKNVEGGIFLALCVSLTVRYKFYAAISEVYFSLALAALLIAWLTKNKAQFPKLTNLQNFLIGLFLVFLLTTSHPIIVLPVLSFFAFDLFYNKQWKNVWNWGLIAATIGAFAFKFIGIQNDSDSYESNRINDTFAQLIDYQSLFDLKVWDILQWYFETQYAFPFVVFVISIIILLARKHIMSSIILILSILALIVVIMLTFAYVNGKIYAMIDGYLGLVGVVVAIPILYAILKSKQHVLSFIVVSVLLLYNLHRIYGTRKYFQKREAYIEQKVEQNVLPEQRKLVLRMQDFIWDKYWFYWALPYETLLLTALESPDKAATIYMAEWNETEEKWGEKTDILLGDGRKIEKFPKQYFRLDTNKAVLITQFPQGYK